MNLPPFIFHLVEQSYLEKHLITTSQDRTYFPATFAEEGFIHCCLEAQIPKILDRYFKAVTQVSVVKVAVAKCNANIIMEAGADGDSYPHIFGGIPPEAWVEHWELKQ